MSRHIKDRGTWGQVASRLLYLLVTPARDATVTSLQEHASSAWRKLLEDPGPLRLAASAHEHGGPRSQSVGWTDCKERAVEVSNQSAERAQVGLSVFALTARSRSSALLPFFGGGFPY